MGTDDWVATTLGDLLRIKHGFAFDGEYFLEEPSGDILLTPGNFAVGGGFKADKIKYYDGPVPADFVLQEDDLLVTMTDLSRQADTLGFPAIVPARNDGRRYLHNQRLGKVEIKEGAPLDKRFLFYLLCTKEYRHEVLASATGTTVKHTSPQRIEQFRFFRPPLQEQRAIAHILGTLDDKVELNRRMNETLEGIVRATFKSWFVDFDPVRAKVEGRDSGLPKHIADLFPDRFEDSELGEIPEGWRVASLPEAMEVNPARSMRKGETAPYVGMASMPTRSARVPVVHEREFSSGMRFVDGDTLVARITPCLENGKMCFVDFLGPGRVGWGSTEFIVLRPRPPLPPEFAYFLARTEGFRGFATSNMTGTSGRQRVPVDCFSQFAMVLPPASVAYWFGRIASATVQKMRAQDEQSRILSTLRDTLLPKLISGELRITAVERFVRSTDL